MADIYAIFGTLLALGLSFPGLLIAWYLLFPKRVDLARHRLVQAPWSNFWSGIGVTILAALPITLLLALPLSGAKLLGVLILLTTLAVASLGTAGLVAGMASRLQGQMGTRHISPGDFVKAAVALELAAAFPLIGWFLVIPITTLISLGAAVLAIFNWVTIPDPGPAGNLSSAQSSPLSIENPPA